MAEQNSKGNMASGGKPPTAGAMLLRFESVANAFAGLYLMALNGAVCDPHDPCPHCRQFFETGRNALDAIDADWGNMFRGGANVQLSEEILTLFLPEAESDSDGASKQQSAGSTPSGKGER